MKISYPIQWTSALCMFVVLAACGKSGDIQTPITEAKTAQTAQQAVTHEVQGVLDSAISDDQKSQSMVGVGLETLQSEQGFTLSKAVFDRAHALDPSNKDAEFMSISLEVPMAFEGIVSELKSALSEKAKAEFESNLEAGVKDLDEEDRDMMNFFIEGKRPKELLINGGSRPIRTFGEINAEEFPIEQVSKLQLILERSIMNKLLHVANRLDAFFIRHPDFRIKFKLPFKNRDKDGKKTALRTVVILDKAAYLVIRAFIYTVSSTIKILVSYDLDDLKSIIDTFIDFKSSENPLENMRSIRNVIMGKQTFLTLRPGVGDVYLSATNDKRVLLTLNNPDFGQGGLVQTLERLKEVLTDKVRNVKDCSDRVHCVPIIEAESSMAHELTHVIQQLKSVTEGPMNIEFTEQRSARIDFTAWLTNRDDNFRDLKFFVPEIEDEVLIKDGAFPLKFADDQTSLGGLFPDGDGADIILEKMKGDFSRDDQIHDNRTSQLTIDADDPRLKIVVSYSTPTNKTRLKLVTDEEFDNNKEKYRFLGRAADQILPPYFFFPVYEYFEAESIRKADLAEGIYRYEAMLNVNNATCKSVLQYYAVKRFIHCPNDNQYVEVSEQPLFYAATNSNPNIGLVPMFEIYKEDLSKVLHSTGLSMNILEKYKEDEGKYRLIETKLVLFYGSTSDKEKGRLLQPASEN